MVARLESVNVGLSRQVEWFGRKVRTAIWKSPVEGRVRAEGVSLVGDQQSDLRVHGGPTKAVYAYSVDDYAWWSEQLDEELGPGTFGDNLTVSGVDLDIVERGEIWRIGTAVFAATAPRQPCFKLGIRMGDAAFKQRFEDADRLGMYFTILEPGDIGAGDEIGIELA